MARVIFAAPAGLGAGAAGGLFQGLRQTWTGWDGSEWVLSDPDSGVFLMPDGVVGLGVGPRERFVSRAAGVPGSRFRGGRELERPVSWPLHVFHDGSSQEWALRDRAFWRTMRAGKTGVWTVQQMPTGEARSLECRFVAVDDEFGLDPVRAGWAEYTVALVAEDPYWRGAPIRRRFSAGSSEDFISVAGPPFTISEGSTIANATIDNPGDVDAWPVWTITGPTTAVTVGIGSSEIGVPGDLDADDVLVIDTDPRRQSATLNGVRQRGVLAPHDFAPIPAGGVSALSLSMVGSGAVTVEIVPRFERAW